MTRRLVLHSHHANANRCPIGVVDFDKRIRTIEEDKPQNERWIRLALIQAIDQRDLPPKARGAGAKGIEAAVAYWVACEGVWAAYREAAVAYNEAKVALGHAGAVYDEAWTAYYEAEATLAASLTPAEWDGWHRAHCGGIALGACHWTTDHPSIFR